MLELLPITEHCQPLLVNLALSFPANCLIQMRPKSLSSKTAQEKKTVFIKGSLWYYLEQQATGNIGEWLGVKI